MAFFGTERRGLLAGGFGCPNPQHLLLCTGMEAFLIDVTAPDHVAELGVVPITAVIHPRGADTHYVRDLTWGEYLHFTSGAAGGDVTDLARRAFGWPYRWTWELARARAEFPAITY